MLKNNKGFTILELLLVLAITSVTAIVLMPSFRSQELRNFESEAMMILEDIRFAQSMAIAHRTNYRIRFDIEQHLYIIERAEASIWVIVKQIHLTYTMFIPPIQGGPIVQFTPRGTTGTAREVRLASASNGTRGNYIASFTINVGSGRVRITNIGRN